MGERAELEAAIEAILFAAAEPVSGEKLLEVFEEGERTEAARALAAVLERYRSPERGVVAEEVGGGYRLATRPELQGYLQRFFEMSGRSRLSMAALETLAIIAYRQPITAPEIQELRGVNPSGVIKTLLERRLIRIAGRKPVVGKPFLYRTHREFLLHFGLRSLEDLPPLEELSDLIEGAAEAAQAVLPGLGDGGETALPDGTESDGEEAFADGAEQAEHAVE